MIQQPTDRERIELYISARKLANKDIVSDSDPLCKIFLSEGNNTQFKQIGQTEVLKNNLNPDWKASIQMDFIFEINQYLKFEVWDHDEGILDDNDLIGVFTTTVGEIMGSKNSVLQGELKQPNHKKQQGLILIKGDKMKSDNNFIFWEWCAKKVKNMDGFFFGESDPFLRFFKQKGENNWLLVHETEFVKNNENPIWKGFEIGVNKLSGGDVNQKIKIELWDNETNGKHQYIGECFTTIAELVNGRRDFETFTKNGKKGGHLHLNQFTTISKPTFIDYIRGGEQLNLMIAIDFTGSNGNPKDTRSLHYNSPGQLNQYQSALLQVSEILLNYDYDKRIPMYGFGGVPHLPNYSKSEADHCFPLTGSFEQPEVNGIEGIMSYYQGALNQVDLSGPTYFAPIIEYASKIAGANINRDIYTILMIITDGEIHDMNKTMDLIIKAARLPLSIIIIGVGNEKFQQMRTLDGDQGPLKGKVQRDLVQFVAFREQCHNQGQLASEVLAELPQQLVNYKQLLGIAPKMGQSVHLSKMGI